MLLVAFLVDIAVAVDSDPAKPSLSWGTLRQVLVERRAVALGTPERLMWEHLRRYLRAEIAFGPGDEDRERALRFWSALTDPMCRPVHVGDMEDLRVRREVGDHVWRGHPGDYQMWLIPLHGRVALFGCPGPSRFAASLLYHIHSYELTRRNEDAYIASRAKERIGREMNRLGEYRWPFLMVQVFAAESASGEIPTIELRNGRASARLRDNVHILNLPDRLEMEYGIGRLLDERTLAAPGGRKLYVAVDWSEYLAAPQRRKWLISELQAAVDPYPDHWFVGAAVHLHVADGQLAWPLPLLRKGELPRATLAGHLSDTAGALALSLASAERYGSARLIFICWNARLSTSDETRQAMGRLRSVLRPRDVQEVVHSVRLQIVQVHGEPVPWMETLAGQRNHNLFDYRPYGPPSVLLPVPED